MSQKKLTNKVALVTGGSRGIGAAIVRRLAADGATVAFTYIRGKKESESIAQEIEKTGGTAFPIQADSADPKAIESAVKTTAQKFGQLDILVNNAGVGATGLIDDDNRNEAAFERQFAINVEGVVAAVRTATKYLKEGGRIVSIGSILGETSPWQGLADYSASKAAVAAYTRGWARDLGARGITVNTVQPGPINTDMNPENSEAASSQRAATALGRYGRPEEVAAAVAFFSSPDSSFITGTTLNVDGGVGA